MACLQPRWNSSHALLVAAVNSSQRNNPYRYYDKARLYRLRYQYWDAMEGGQQAVAQDARNQAKDLLKQWPKNLNLRQYAGEQIPWGQQYLADTRKHPFRSRPLPSRASVEPPSAAMTQRS